MTEGDRPSAAHELVIAVVTYRRPDQLGHLLPILKRETADLERAHPGRFTTSLLVVDNDPERSAAFAAADPQVTYRVEMTPGVAAARNRALAEASDTALLVFIDDDESPLPGWLRNLVETHLSYAADVVAGPVISRWSGQIDPFVAAGGFLDRPHRAGLQTGTMITRAATNNLLLDLAVVRSLKTGFDSRFGLSGGEDSLFTGQLQQRGASMVWCAEAEVIDHVPPERMTREYVIGRVRTLSNSAVHAELALRERPLRRWSYRLRELVRETVRMGYGGALLVRARIGGSLSDSARGQGMVARSSGALTALAGKRFQPYARGGDD